MTTINKSAIYTIGSTEKFFTREALLHTVRTAFAGGYALDAPGFRPASGTQAVRLSNVSSNTEFFSFGQAEAYPFDQLTDDELLYLLTYVHGGFLTAVDPAMKEMFSLKDDYDHHAVKELTLVSL